MAGRATLARDGPGVPGHGRRVPRGATCRNALRAAMPFEVLKLAREVNASQAVYESQPSAVASVIELASREAHSSALGRT
jgi:hypothetical protein